MRRQGYSVDSDNEEDDEDDCSLLDSISIGTGRYTDPGNQHHHHARRKLRKNRFPLWLCHKRKPSVPYDEEDDVRDDSGGGHTDEYNHVEMAQVVPTTVLYESPPRPLSNEMYKNSTFFPDGVLTKSTLDLLCCPDEEEPEDSLPSSTQHLLSKTSASSQDSITHNRRQDQGRIAASSSMSSPRSSNATTCSSEAPAILPGAVHDQLQSMLDLNHRNDSRRHDCRDDRAHVATAIDRWGGRRRGGGSGSCSSNNSTSTSTTSVAQRRRQLQQAMERGKPVSHVKRIQWHVCPTTGLYKKKIIVEPKSNIYNSK